MMDNGLQKSFASFVKDEIFKVARENDGKKITGKKLVEKAVIGAGYNHAKERLNSPNKGLVKS